MMLAVKSISSTEIRARAVAAAVLMVETMMRKTRERQTEVAVLLWFST